MAAVSKNTKKIMRIIGGILQTILNVLFYMLVIITVMRFSAAAYEVAYEVFGNVTVQEEPGRDIPVTIEKGESTLKVAEKLEERGIIVNRYSFFIRAKITISSKHPIIPGEYMLNNSMPYETILEIITKTEAEENGAEE